MRAFNIMSIAGLALGCGLSTGSAFAGDLTVQVNGITAAKGEIACSLFKSATGFPAGSVDEVRQWVPAKVGSITCHYTNIAGGPYAVAVFHDVKGTHKLETDMVGFPSEPTGVSNNVSANFGPPAFKDAAFTVEDAAKKTIAITIK